MFEPAARTAILYAALLLPAEGEGRLEVVLAVGLEGDQGLRRLDALDLVEPAGDDLVQVLVPAYAHHRDEVDVAGDGVDLAHAVEIGDGLRHLRDPVDGGI